MPKKATPDGLVEKTSQAAKPKTVSQRRVGVIGSPPSSPGPSSIENPKFTKRGGAIVSNQETQKSDVDTGSDSAIAARAMREINRVIKAMNQGKLSERADVAGLSGKGWRPPMV